MLAMLPTLHGRFVADTLSAGEGEGEADGHDLTEEHQELLAHYQKNAPSPPVPGSEFCMQSAAVVVTGIDDAELASVVKLDASVPMESLKNIGTLQLMVTNVDDEFAEFGKLTGGRSLGALRLLGYEEDGKLVVDSADTITRLPVVEIGDQRYVFAKE